MNKYKYVKVSEAKRRGSLNAKLTLSLYPNAGPHPNIKGMRNKYWGKDAYIIKSGAYAYNVPRNVFEAY
jgi:hypothetical protein